MSEKKSLSLILLKILKAHSTETQPLTIAKISKILKEEHNRSTDPRTLKSTINTLIDCGYPIKRNEEILKNERKNSWYYEPYISADECELLSIALDTSTYIDNKTCCKLKEKFSAVTAYNFDQKNYVKAKTEHLSSEEILGYINRINSAIKGNKYISFSIITHFINKSRCFERNNLTTKIYVARPIKTIIAYGTFLVFCELGDTGIYRYFPIERMYDIQIAGEYQGCSNPINTPLPQSILEATSLTFSERQRATVRVHNSYLSEFVEQLGQDCELICKYDDKTEIAITTDLRALKHLILSFGSYAEALSPTKLRRSVALELRAACAKYPEVRKLYGSV